ncbi:MAG: malonyl-ACP O-methyltransferase BioC [Methylovulum sp.]|nr:malonyl-ACP O-methyltransferase BioC [Methylovulum sp.]
MPLSLDKTQLRLAFSAAAPSYDRFAPLQRSVAQALLTTVDVGSLSGTLLDIGCGTGFLTGELLALPACTAGKVSVIALDIALTMLQTARRKLSGQTQVYYICADAEALPLAGGSIDRVFSSLALQWCSRLDECLKDIRRVLKPGGQLTFSTFGAGTLQELKAAWATVDDYSHVNDFYSEQAIAGLLQQAGFRAISISSTSYRPCYGSVWALMRELKGIGAHNVLAARNRQVTGKNAMQAMVAAYQAACGDNAIAATFEVITVTATR